ncbi:MAG: peptidase M54 [Thermococci archaeon]|nr:peptidase M54 [Thermococci archaeon]
MQRNVEYVGATYVGRFLDRDLVFEIFDSANRYFVDSGIPVRFLYLGKTEVGPEYLISVRTEEGNVRGYPLEAVRETLHARLVAEINNSENGVVMNKILALMAFPLFSRNPSFHVYEKFLGMQSDVGGLKIMMLSIKPFEDGNENLLRRRILKGVLHELGHGFGLSHCSNECVMNPPSTIEEWDLRPMGFCDSCRRKLMESIAAEIKAGSETAGLITRQG